MRKLHPWSFVLLGVLLVVGCGEQSDEQVIPEECPGGPCETPRECEKACEGVCQDRDFGSFDCIEEQCICECFYGCP